MKGIKNIYITVLVFSYVFGFSISGFPLNSAKVSLVLLSIELLMKKKCRHIARRLFSSKVIILSIISLVLLSAYSAWIPALKGTHDFTLSYNYFIFVLERVIGSVLVVSYLYGQKYGSYEIIDIIIRVLVIQSAIIILMFVFPDIRDFFWSLNEKSYLANLNQRYGGIRGLGLSGEIAYTLSVVLSFGCILIAYRSITSNNIYVYSVYTILLLLGIMFSGRTGWLGVAIAVLFFIYLRYNKKIILNSTLNFVKSLLILSPIILFTYLSLDASVIATIKDVLIPFAFEVFINLFEQGEIHASSMEATQNMYFWVPESTFWFGDGRFLSLPGADHSYYMHTDPGYMRHLLFYGFVGSSLLYSIYIGLVVYTYNVKALSLGWEYKFLVILIIFLLFVVHWKGDVLVGSNSNVKILFLLLGLLVISSDDVTWDN